MIFHAPNAVDIEFLANRSNLSGSNQTAHLPPRFFLYVGRLVPEKGVFDLLAAYRNLPRGVREDFGLVFVGSGVCRAELETRARGLKSGTIAFTGFLEKEELADIYARAAALVLPTHSDVWGLVVNEAMACGLPIIASSVAGCVADLVEDGWNGRIVAAGNPDVLGAAMQSLALDPELRSTMSARSRQRSRDYSPEACARGLAQAALGMEAVRG
jgi:glycosyltransferase involved in cell wall biosynthesis